MNANHISQIRLALARANGKRRERIAYLPAVLHVVIRVAKGESEQGLCRICGTVPNSCKYAASATHIIAARVGDVVRVRIVDGYAAKVSGGGAGFAEGSKSADVAGLLAAEAGALPTGTIEIPVASARRLPRGEVAAAAEPQREAA